MRVRLALAGQRPINNLVDISNFVMLETGQPLHFFDYAKIANAHIIVRDAKPGEHLTTLDGTDRALDPTALLIADETQATGLAGLMGGPISEVSETTTRDRDRERELHRTARAPHEREARPAQRSLDAQREESAARAHRSRRGARGRAARGRRRHACAHPSRTARRSPRPRRSRCRRATSRVCSASRSTMRRSRARCNRSASRVADGGTAFAVIAPAWRSDIAIPADIVEEIARVVGYDRLEAAMPRGRRAAALERRRSIATTRWRQRSPGSAIASA